MYPGRKSLVAIRPGVTPESSQVVVVVASFGGTINRSDPGVERSAAPAGKVILPACPECGGRLVCNGGCFTCVICGWGACG